MLFVWLWLIACVRHVPNWILIESAPQKKSKKKGIPAGAGMYKAGMYIDRGLSYDIRIIILMTRRHREK